MGGATPSHSYFLRRIPVLPRDLDLDCKVLAQVEPLPPRPRSALAKRTGLTAFATTHWSVLAVPPKDPHAPRRKLWNGFAALIGNHSTPCSARGVGAGGSPQDLTQGFFARLLFERRDLAAVRREKGRLRSYLLISLKHFLLLTRGTVLSH